MNTNHSTPQSGFFTPRILVAFALCSIGLLLGVFSVAATPPVETRAVTNVPPDPANFLSTSTFGSNANRLPPGVPLPPGARFAPAGQGDPSSSDPTALSPGSPGMPLAPAAAGGWSIVPSPNARGEIFHFLEAVTCVSASDCWAVGYRHIPPLGNNYRPQTLIEHWDGTAWTIIDTPNVGVAVENVLRGVTCVSASDCWAVGNYESENFQRTLIMHWDGASWAIVASPNDENTPPRPNRLSEVACTSTSGCWAVGVANNQALILRWNGTSWQKFPQALPVGSLAAVTCVSASDCWAVGTRIVNNVGETLIEHWDGTVWTVVPAPLPGVLSSFTDVTCVSASDCWAVGRYRGNPEEPLIARWNGISWTLVLSPLPPGLGGVLESVTCASKSECWAVGNSYFLDSETPRKTLIERWDGNSWTIVSSPIHGVGNNVLADVTCVSAGDCWAVGSGFSDDAKNRQTLIERWNGTAWTIVDSPNALFVQNNAIEHVACVSASDCWAVGRYANGRPDGDGAVDYKTLIEHWDGTSWTIVPSPNTSPLAENYLTAVTCVSASDCWAVGYSRGDDGYQTLIERWNGTSWAIVPSPNPSSNINLLYSVTCASASECWAVGFRAGDLGFETLIQRWNGTSWTVVPSPNTAAAINYLYSVTCASASQCWAVGYSDDLNGKAVTIIERWDGTSWTIVPSPNPHPTANFLVGVTCGSASECWAIGFNRGGDGFMKPLVERWDGTSWTVVPLASPAASDHFLLGVTCGSASECWAAGSTNDGTDLRTLIYRWDGISWAIFSSPITAEGQDNNLRGVTCAPASDCWAVGFYNAETNGHGQRTLTMRLAASASPALTQVVSRKTHGGTGPFDINLPLTGNPGIECRSGGTSGNHTLIFTFAVPVTFTSATVTSGTGTVSSTSISGNQVFVNVTGVGNAQTIKINLTNVSDGTNVGNVVVPMGVLLGDVDATGRTDSGDVSLVRQKTVSVPDNATFRNDVNATGRIDAGDVTVTRNNSVTVLPSSP